MRKSLLKVAHDIASDLYDVNAIDAQTMREFDVKCLPPVKHYAPRQIKKIRLRNKVSQAIFAAYLNTSPSTIQQWEQGLKKPSGISLKILNLIDHHNLAYVAA
ncbi:MAG: DNA-binding transcriptional regulator [Proteobacteria bacterium]|nr:DNA-binding transcriptional regulator [Pseudomonadota bacterium]